MGKVYKNKTYVTRFETDCYVKNLETGDVYVYDGDEWEYDTKSNLFKEYPDCVEFENEDGSGDPRIHYAIFVNMTKYFNDKFCLPVTTVNALIDCDEYKKVDEKGKAIK